jgi:hypothetical protein
VINGVQASDKKICTAFKTIEQARGNTAAGFLGNLANHPVFQGRPLVFPKFTLNGVIVFHCFLLLSWLLCLRCGII